MMAFFQGIGPPGRGPQRAGPAVPKVGPHPARRAFFCEARYLARRAYFFGPATRPGGP